MDEDAIKQSIQQTLDNYARAYNENNKDLLYQAIDPASGPFRRLVVSRFENDQESIFGGAFNYNLVVGKLTQRDLGFVTAQVLFRGTSQGAEWTFRNVQNAWLLSEPTERQIGERVKTETEHFIFYTYPWSEQVNDEIKDLMERAYTQVVERLGKAPETKAEVTIRPIFGIGTTSSSGTLAWYMRGSNQDRDRIVVYAPQTYSYGFYNLDNGWQPKLEQTLVHEYTHLVNHRSFVPMHRMSDWMIEGIAEFVSESARTFEVAEAVRRDQIIPIIDSEDGVNRQDLTTLTRLRQDVSLAYGLSYELVAYIDENHGGLDGFWKLAEAYDKAQDLDKALREAYGISYDEFDAGWRAWLKQKYG
jgi:hypothetical protein